MLVFQSIQSLDYTVDNDMKSLRMQRVFLFSNDTMFGHGIQCLLGSAVNIQIVGMESNHEQAIQEILQVQPDAVILDDECCSTDILAKLVGLCECEPQMKIIKVSLKDNSVFCLHTERYPIRSIDDLMDVIDWRPYRENGPRDE